jgi:hypothetical protein
MQSLLTPLRRLLARLRTTRGQGTVEYVGIVLAVGALLLAFSSALPREAAGAVAKKVESAVVKAIDKTVGDDSTASSAGG